MWNIGDVVRLKSGGPRMTVMAVELDEPNYVDVMWFVVVGEAGRQSLLWRRREVVMHVNMLKAAQ